jgi:iron(III) transport system ATP-binding protein
MSDLPEVYVRLSNVSKTFASFAALKDVSFSVNRGELVCLLGPSGCGKTTLLRAIAGLDSQTRGRIELAGRDVSRLPPAKRNFGIVFQSYALFPNLTVAENVGYGLVARGVRRREVETRVTELLALIGLPTESRKYPAQLSGGQQQRVALARALATSPALLLLDEPLSALDAQVRLYLRDELRALQRRLGITTILVTHDQEEALAVADRIILMRSGAVEQIGTAKEMYDEPASEFAMRFVGASTCLPGTMTGPNRVRVGPSELTTAAPAAARAGEPVVVCFRPEDVRIGSDAAQNSFHVIARTFTFKGSHWRTALALASDGSVVIHADFPADDFRGAPLCEGARLWIEIAPERIHVFPRRS